MAGEDAIFDLNPYCGQAGSGHAVLLVGYNDTTRPRKWYWEMLNSWGATLLRWRGTFRVNMDLDYDWHLHRGCRHLSAVDLRYPQRRILELAS